MQLSAARAQTSPTGPTNERSRRRQRYRRRCGESGRSWLCDRIRRVARDVRGTCGRTVSRNVAGRATRRCPKLREQAGRTLEMDLQVVASDRDHALARWQGAALFHWRGPTLLEAASVCEVSSTRFAIRRPPPRPSSLGSSRPKARRPRLRSEKSWRPRVLQARPDGTGASRSRCVVASPVHAGGT